MDNPVMTSWSEYQSAVDRLLAMPLAELRIYDRDLSRLGLEKSQRCEALKTLLRRDGSPRVSIIVRDARFIRENAPRLLDLLRQHSHSMSIQETPENLAHLRDGMLIGDDEHALILFDQDQPRSKMILNDKTSTSPYRQRFDEISESGGQPVSASVTGL